MTFLTTSLTFTLRLNNSLNATIKGLGEEKKKIIKVNKRDWGKYEPWALEDKVSTCVAPSVRVHLYEKFKQPLH